MNASGNIRKYAAELRVCKGNVLKTNMEEKVKEFVEKDVQVYAMALWPQFQPEGFSDKLFTALQSELPKSAHGLEPNGLYRVICAAQYAIHAMFL